MFDGLGVFVACAECLADYGLNEADYVMFGQIN